jgi:Gas vesicle synthesis protein GvpL/GvpF
VIHLYAFTLGQRELPEIDGVDGATLEARPFAPLTAVVSVGAGSGEVSDDAVRHGLVVEALLECADSVLPVRFGQQFEDEQELAAAVAERRYALETALADLSGCVEVGVRVLREDGPFPTDAANGTEYMRAVAGRKAATVGLHRALLPHARASLAAPSSRLRDDTGYLVRREDVPEFALAVDRYVAAHPELTVLCTGPWAPYSFAAAT